MANGPYSPSGGYRNDRAREERDPARQSSQEYREGDTGYVRGFGDYQRSSDDGYGGRDQSDRARQPQNGRGDQRGREDFSYQSGYGDNDQSRVWARESYRADPSSFSYQPNHLRNTRASGDRYGSGLEHRAGPDRYSSDPRQGDSEKADHRRGFMERAGDEVASWLGDRGAEQRRAIDEHRGKGPKGYQRSDARIEEDINDRLSDDPMLDASNITVTVKGGEVTLDGFVSSRLDKRRAEDLADDVSGVRHVQNNLRLNNGSSDSLTGSTTV
ncbi:BON domain-containing protein [Rhizobium deserti]|uniref:BON domain-containing protein n=1 Tax=Rhizobium deserti TaxID=2547961 RepID=A0A4R5UP49_9HYPH|nr:BON domain-containing protein [Rhizobium deserti]TDK39599.1 BON domain-containing protein [Rhizobium deserti]